MIFQKKIRILILIIIASLILPLQGCYNSADKNIQYKSSNFENDINKLIDKNVLYEFEMKEIIKDNSFIFASFLINNNNSIMQGLVYIEEYDNHYKLVEFKMDDVQLNIPFSPQIIEISLNDGRKCKLISGYINNDNIKQIQLEFNNNNIKALIIGSEQKVFLDYIIGDVDSINKIIAYDENLNIVHSYHSD